MSIEERISQEALELKNITELASDVVEKAQSTPEEVRNVLTDIIVETSPKNSLEQERATLVFGEVSKLGFTKNSHNMLESITNTGVETPFRDLLVRYNHALELSPEQQAEAISTHYQKVLEQAATINAALSKINEKNI